MNKQEEKILRAVVHSYTRDKAPFYVRTPFVVVGWFALVALLVVVKRLMELGEINVYVAISLLLLSGVAIGFVSIVKASYKFQPFIKPYLDIKAIERKLSGADSNA